MQRIKEWLIHKLGGRTQYEQSSVQRYHHGQAVYWRDRAVSAERDASNWEKRARKAEARVKALESLDDRLRRLVHLRAEVHESHEWMYRNQVSRRELTEYIRGKLAMQLADAILGSVGVSEKEDRLRMEYAWTCEAYLLKKEENDG